MDIQTDLLTAKQFEKGAPVPSEAELPSVFIPDVVKHAAPDLIVIIVQVGEPARSVFDQVRNYLTHGTQLVWTVYPLARDVEVYQLQPPDTLITRRMDEHGTLDSGPVLQGLRLPVKVVFPA